MGNWRTVTMIGTVDATEIEPFRAAVAYSFDNPGTLDSFGPLSYDPDSPGLASLSGWVRPTIVAGGNLAERDYGPEDIAEHLRKLVAVAPSLELKVHCGDDWESEQCIATVIVHEGQVSVGPPEVKSVSGASDDEMMGRLTQHLRR